MSIERSPLSAEMHGLNHHDVQAPHQITFIKDPLVLHIRLRRQFTGPGEYNPGRNQTVRLGKANTQHVIQALYMVDLTAIRQYRPGESVLVTGQARRAVSLRKTTDARSKWSDPETVRRWLGTVPQDSDVSSIWSAHRKALVQQSGLWKLCQVHLNDT